MKKCMTDNEMLAYLKKKGNVKLRELCRDLAISESTARRMLSRLDEKKLIFRYPGGAMASIETQRETAYDERLFHNQTAKTKIARKAAGYIKSGSCIMLLGGTTVSEICPLIKNIPLTVISNSLGIFEELKANPLTNLILLGGRYNHDERELHGNITNMGLGIMHADMVFLGCNGFNLTRGYSTNDFDSVSFYQLCIENSDKAFVLADSTKVGKTANVIFAGVKDIDLIITDDNITAEQEDELKSANIRYEVAGKNG